MMHEHDGYQPHSHEVRADHFGVLQAEVPPVKPAYGSSEAYPSTVAWYGTEGLMAMAGTLAEATEHDLGEIDSPTGPGRWQAQAAVAQVYATLAHAQAVRDQTDVLRGITSQLAETVERLEVVLEEVAENG